MLLQCAEISAKGNSTEFGAAEKNEMTHHPFYGLDEDKFVDISACPDLCLGCLFSGQAAHSLYSLPDVSPPPEATSYMWNNITGQSENIIITQTN